MLEPREPLSANEQQAYNEQKTWEKKMIEPIKIQNISSTITWQDGGSLLTRSRCRFLSSYSSCISLVWYDCFFDSEVVLSKLLTITCSAPEEWFSLLVSKSFVGIFGREEGVLVQSSCDWGSWCWKNQYYQEIRSSIFLRTLQSYNILYFKGDLEDNSPPLSHDKLFIFIYPIHSCYIAGI